MLKTTLQSINKVLDSLYEITIQDIEDIKEAKHEPLFERNSQKEKLLLQFAKLKGQIDNILRQRSTNGQDLASLITKEEDVLLGEFKEKLSKFYKTHKKFSKMALSVANFYNHLMQKISGEQIGIGYKKTYTKKTNLSLRA
jgi:ElaB/YqjD/DUF883 family membrane-anchored ribosome-binding protein